MFPCDADSVRNFDRACAIRRTRMRPPTITDNGFSFGEFLYMNRLVLLTSLAAALSLPVQSLQAESRGPGWEFSADVLYQGSQDIEFNGGSSTSLEDDYGLRLSFGYRLNDRMEFQFG